MSVVIKARERGPLVVTPIEGCRVFRADGSEVDLSAMKSLRLCRCGASSIKPLCDGAHNRVGFEAPSVPADESGDAPTEDPTSTRDASR